MIIGQITGELIPRSEFLDFCRISWGKIAGLSETHNYATIKYRPLVIEGKYRLGSPAEKRVNWNRAWQPNLKIGQWVSTHWSHAIQVLTEEEVRNLQKYTQQTLDTLNAALSGKSR